MAIQRPRPLSAFFLLWRKPSKNYIIYRMLVSDFNYNLPEENIAKRPPKVRGTTRLLVLNKQTGEITDSHYADVADFLEPGDLIILNDTRVMRARLFVPDHERGSLLACHRSGPAFLCTVRYDRVPGDCLYADPGADYDGCSESSCRIHSLCGPYEQWCCLYFADRRSAESESDDCLPFHEPGKRFFGCFGMDRAGSGPERP